MGQALNWLNFRNGGGDVSLPILLRAPKIKTLKNIKIETGEQCMEQQRRKVSKTIAPQS